MIFCAFGCVFCIAMASPLVAKGLEPRYHTDLLIAGIEFLCAFVCLTMALYSAKAKS